MSWQSDIRRWARDQRITRATISGCGEERHLTVTSCIRRIETVHCNPLGFTAHPDGDRGVITVSDRNGRTVAVITPAVWARL